MKNICFFFFKSSKYFESYGVGTKIIFCEVDVNDGACSLVWPWPWGRDDSIYFPILKSICAKFWNRPLNLKDIGRTRTLNGGSRTDGGSDGRRFIIYLPIALNTWTNVGLLAVYYQYTLNILNVCPMCLWSDKLHHISYINLIHLKLLLLLNLLFFQKNVTQFQQINNTFVCRMKRKYNVLELDLTFLSFTMGWSYFHVFGIKHDHIIYLVKFQKLSNNSPTTKLNKACFLLIKEISDGPLIKYTSLIFISLTNIHAVIYFILRDGW